MEETLIDIMYELPSEENVSKCVIGKECITSHKPPELIYKERQEMARALSESVS